LIILIILGEEYKCTNIYIYIYIYIHNTHKHTHTYMYKLVENSLWNSTGNRFVHLFNLNPLSFLFSSLSCLHLLSSLLR
jgi:hypothetical protein